jgi:hypothetical protein
VADELSARTANDFVRLDRLQREVNLNSAIAGEGHNDDLGRNFARHLEEIESSVSQSVRVEFRQREPAKDIIASESL